MNEQEIAERLIQFALAPTVSVAIAAMEPTDDPESFRSASGVLVRLGGVPYLITNSHVIEAYRGLAAQRKTQFFFPDNAVDLIERLHSESQELDLAMLLAYNLRIRIDRNRAAGVPDIRMLEPEQWPPAAPRAGDSVCFAGWPEVGRRIDIENMEAKFQPYAYVGATIQDVTACGFTIPFDPAGFRGVTGRETREQLQEQNLSGLSGGSVFRDMSAFGRAPELVGIIEKHAGTWGLLIATSSLHLRASGSIERYIP